jgi:hypothetical protein
MSIKLYEKLYNHTVELYPIYLISDVRGEYYLDELLDDLCMSDEELQKEFAVALGEGEDMASHLMENCCGYYIAKAETPVRKKGVSHFSWGSTTYTVILAKSMDELALKACNWADKYRERVLIGETNDDS